MRESPLPVAATPCGSEANPSPYRPEDTAFVSRLVDAVNALNPDVVVFTGDIVNRRSTELLPFVQPLSRLKAPMGVYSVLGNHDYGDYYNWPDSGLWLRSILNAGSAKSPG